MIDSSTFNAIAAIMEIAFVLLFVLVAVRLIIFGIVGYKRGVYKSTYRMIGLGLLFFLAVATVRPLVEVVLDFDISGFFDGPIVAEFNLLNKDFLIEVNPGTVESTLTDFVSGFCNQINASEYVSDITQFVKTLVFSIVSLCVYILDLSLITTTGVVFLEVLWVLVFKKAAPKIAQRLGKLRFIGMVEAIVTDVVLLFLFMTPFTSLVNSINQGIQQSDAKKSQNETVQEVVRLVDIYNDSLFARTFFNWNTSLNEGRLTFDELIMESFAKTVNGGVDAISLSQEIGNLIYSIGQVASVLGPNNENGIPTITEFSDSLITPIIDIFTESTFFSSLLEISAKLALDSDLLYSVIPNSDYFEKIDLEGISLEEELQVFENMGSDIIESGILDDFINKETYEFSTPDNIVDYLDDLFTEESNRPRVKSLINVFSRIDEFKLLDRAIQSLGYWGVTNDTEMTVLKYLGGNTELAEPYKDEGNKQIVNNFIDEIHIGNELYMLFDALWGLASCGDHVIKYAYNAFTSEDETIKNDAKASLVATLKETKTTENFRDSICGVNHMEADGTAKERDSEKGEHYALLDSKIVTKFVNETPFMKNVLENFKLEEKFGSGYEPAKNRWNTLMSEVYDSSASVLPVGFFKEEINDVLTVITNVIQMETPVSSSTSTSVPYKARFNEDPSDPVDPGEPSDPEEPKEPFYYVDYTCFLEAAVNLFDHWINPDDVLGSMLDLDSRVAPYLAEAFKCLTPLDNSKIVYALGIPFVTAKMSDSKEQTQDYFDIDICINQINSSNNVFHQLSDLIDGNFVSILQHFYKGFLVNDEGQFDVAVLTDSISGDIGGFLNKFNEHVLITSDDPETPENEAKYDDKPLKYYFAELLKSFYNFELFNPHSGINKNKNMEYIFDYVFGFMESFGVEKPSDQTYRLLDSVEKWEAELDGVTDLFAVLGKNNMLKFTDYSSNINSTLLYSLSGDIAKAELLPDYSSDMPKNLGEVLHAVGDSVLFSTMMGGLLDQNLDGTLCDSAIGVAFKNIETGEYWHLEGDNMNKLLSSIAKLDLDLQNLDFTKITDVVGLNDMLHCLCDSQIFNNESGNKFGEWLFGKVNTAMDSMSGGLLDDPDASVWDSSWDTALADVDNADHPQQKIAYYDFLVRDGVMPSNYEDNKAGWSESGYEAKMTTFKTVQNYETLSKAEVDELYKQPGFMDDYYDAVLKYDEIGRLVNVLSNGIRIMDGGSSIDFNNLSANDLDSLLTAINNTDCLRIASYNAMSLAKSSVGSNELVDIEKAKFEFLITADQAFTDYENARIDRQIEIDHIVNFYSDYKELQRIAGDNLDSSSFFNKAKLMEILGVDANGDDDPNGNDCLTGMLAELQATQCFNLSTVEHRVSNELSFFENLMVNLMDTSGLLELAETNLSTMENRARKISNCDISGTLNNEGYNSSWTELDGSENIIGGENASFTNIMKKVIGITDGDTIDADAIKITDLAASQVTDIMQAINGSYLCTGVMKHFIKEAFTGEMGLESLLKYDAADTDMIADFDLTYVDYGGPANACEDGTEIYNFQKAISAMQYEDPITHENKFVSLDNLSDALAKKSDCFDGIFYFLYNSKTLAKTEIRNSYEIKGRSLLLFNSLSNFDSYLIGNDKDNKIDSIEKLFNVSLTENSNAYLIEANGISRVIDATGNSISGITIDNLRNNPTTRDMILNTIKYTYDRNDGNTAFTTDTDITVGRAYFASEIISGVFDEVLNTEYTTIASNFSAARLATFDDYDKFYFASKTNGGKAEKATDITATVFDNLNEVERTGLDGMISMTEFINGDADRSGTDTTNIASNPFVLALTSNSTTIRELFSTKLYNNGQDSRMAKVLYVSRGAQTIEKETHYADDSFPANSGLIVMLRYSVNYPYVGGVPSGYVWQGTYTEDYYDPDFDFDTYGNALMDYVDSSTYPQCV